LKDRKINLMNDFKTYHTVQCNGDDMLGNSQKCNINSHLINGISIDPIDKDLVADGPPYIIDL
jgi:hypothetical protein